MAIDVGIGALVDTLFAAAPEVAAAEAVAAPEELAAAGAAGGLASEIAAGTAPEILASAGPALAAGDVAGQVAAEGGLAAGLSAPEVLAGTTAASDLISPELAGVVSEQLGGGGGTALGFTGAPTADLSSSEGIQAINQALASPTGSAAQVAGSGGVTPATTELAQGPESINALLGADTGPGADIGPTTRELAFSGQAGTNVGSQGGISNVGGQAVAPAGAGSEVAASAQVPGLSNVGQFAPAPGNLSGAAEADIAAAQAGGAAAAAPPSFMDTLGNVGSSLGSVASNPLAQMALPAGFLAYNMIRGPQPIPPQATEAINNARATYPGLAAEANQNVGLYNQTAQQDLNLANNFQISPAQAAAIANWTNDRQNELRQQIANQQPGVDYRSTTQWIEGNNQIQQQALAQQTQMINQLIQTAFQASSAANAGVSTSANVDAQFNSLLMQSAQLQVQQDQNFNTAVGAAMNAFGLIAGLGARRLTPATTATA